MDSVTLMGRTLTVSHIVKWTTSISVWKMQYQPGMYGVFLTISPRLLRKKGATLDCIEGIEKEDQEKMLQEEDRG